MAQKCSSCCTTPSRISEQNRREDGDDESLTLSHNSNESRGKGDKEDSPALSHIIPHERHRHNDEDESLTPSRMCKGCCGENGEDESQSLTLLRISLESCGENEEEVSLTPSSVSRGTYGGENDENACLTLSHFSQGCRGENDEDDSLTSSRISQVTSGENDGDDSLTSSRIYQVSSGENDEDDSLTSSRISQVSRGENDEDDSLTSSRTSQVSRGENDEGDSLTSSHMCRGSYGDNGENEIPFISECEVRHEGYTERSHLLHGCEKNPGHQTFIPVEDFKMRHLPSRYRTEDTMRCIKQWCDFTVRVVVKYTSENRPDTFSNSSSPYPFCKIRGSSRKTRFGTGYMSAFVEELNETCPCHQCRISNEPKKGCQRLFVKTTTHVVFDDLELQQTTFELFYDSEDRGSVKYVYGANILDDPEERYVKDVVTILCYAHHLLLPDLYQIYENNSFLSKYDKSFGIIVSHPHGASKHITVGSIVKSALPFRYAHDAFEIVEQELTAPLDGVELYKANHEEDRSQRYMLCRYSNRIVGRLPLTTTEPPSTLRMFVAKKDFLYIYYRFKNLKVLIPSDAKIILQNENYEERWVKFNSNARFYFENMNESLSLPDMEFLDFIVPLVRFYNIDTCPGCSGAPVITDFGSLLSLSNFIHSGSSTSAKGIRSNQSAAEFFRCPSLLGYSGDFSPWPY